MVSNDLPGRSLETTRNVHNSTEELYMQASPNSIRVELLAGASSWMWLNCWTIFSPCFPESSSVVNKPQRRRKLSVNGCWTEALLSRCVLVWMRSEASEENVNKNVIWRSRLIWDHGFAHSLDGRRELATDGLRTLLDQDWAILCVPFSVASQCEYNARLVKRAITTCFRLVFWSATVAISSRNLFWRHEIRTQP